MDIYYHLEELATFKEPIVLTIGNFDGVHRGHLSLLQKVRHFAKPEGQTIVLTFSNHPSEILRPEQPVLLLCTLAHKLLLFEQNKIDAAVIIPFNLNLAKHSAASFVEKVRQFIPFSHLVLGHDATLGRDRQGNREVMKELGEIWGFKVEYIDEYRHEGVPISSTGIRQLVQAGNLEEASHRLGRPYSIYSSVVPGQGKGKELGFPTLNIDVKGLCLPPFGVYAVKIHLHGQTLQAIANLGYAPTLREDPLLVLEVHILEKTFQYAHQEAIEVIFEYFIRPEKKFGNIEELKQQIAEDIQKVNLLN